MRVKGIYALEHVISISSERDYPAVIEILTSYVRENASVKRTLHTESTGLPADIQTILTVLGRRTRTYRQEATQSLKLEETNLQGANLNWAQFQRANLRGAQLQGANLRGAQLQETILWDTQLQGAYLRGAQLQGANLRGAQLQRVDLTAVKNLTQDQINMTCIDETAIPPAGLTRPAPCPVKP
jgi:hypothetical protein